MVQVELSVRPALFILLLLVRVIVDGPRLQATRCLRPSSVLRQQRCHFAAAVTERQHDFGDGGCHTSPAVR